MSKFVLKGVPVVISALCVAGSFILLSDYIMVLRMRWKMRSRLRPNRSDGRLLTLSSNLLSSYFGKNIDGIYLLIFEVTLFFTCFTLFFRICSLLLSIVSSLIFTTLPILLLISNVYKQRIKGRDEGLSFVTELYRQYRMCNLNILDALEKTSCIKDSFPFCSRQTYILLLRLRDAQSKENIDQSIKQYAFALGSSWGRMLSSAIEISMLKGSDISMALVDITNQLKTSRLLVEERKQLNSEALRMTVFLVPLMYASTFLISVKYLGISVSKFLSNQFLTKEGLIFLTLSIFMFVINNLILSFVEISSVDF